MEFTTFHKQLVNFYNDIGFMAALFYIDMLDNVDIYEIASHFNSKASSNLLAKIIENGADGNNNDELFKNYLKMREIKYLDPKRALTAKIFYYILHNRIDYDIGIKFVSSKVCNRENVINYLGDDVGIEQILGNYYAIDDGDVTYDKDIERLIDLIFLEMKQYIDNHLVNFSLDNTICIFRTHLNT